MESGEEKINLTYLNGTGFVFNADDYMKLRTKHRVIGSMVGTCCTRGWSANACSLPVELTAEETQLLLEKGVAVLLSKSASLLRTPTDKEVQIYKHDTEERLRQQAEHLKDGKVNESLHYIDKIIQGKRNKLLKSGIPEGEIHLTKEDVLQEIRSSVVFERKNALVEIHCEHPRIHEGIRVNFPTENSLKYRVFKDFWERGKYITCGEAFGAEFIVYPGDPAIFHASHIVILLATPSIDPLEMIAKVRMSVIVNKLCVFAYEGQDNQISYQTVEWKGNKEGKPQ